MIAERVLSVKTDQGPKPVRIQLDTPVKTSLGYACRYEIHWPDETHQRTAYGADGIQAILLALQMIGTDLYASDAHRENRLNDPLQPEGGYGFPLPHLLSDLLVGGDKPKD